MNSALLQHLHIESTTKQVAHCLQHVIDEATLNNLTRPLYIELGHFKREVVQLQHVLFNLSNHILPLVFWQQVSADLFKAKAALDSTVNTIYRIEKMSVGVLRREKNIFVNALNRFKALRKSLQTVYIGVCNSAYSTPVQDKLHLQTHEPQPSNIIRDQSSCPVYIVHASEDKLTIALPLRRQLRGNGIQSFLGKEEMQVGDDKERALKRAMDAAQICVVIISPEMVAEKWPMLEVHHFLKRSRSEGGRGPFILPVFYRLCLGDCHGYEYLRCQDGEGRNLFIKRGLFKGIMCGQSSLHSVVECLRELTGRVGLENDEDASNEDTTKMGRSRERLISRVVGAVASLVYKCNALREEGP